MRAFSTAPDASIQTVAAAERTAKSIEPRRRSFQKAERQAVASLSLERRTSERISSGRLARYWMPSSRKRSSTGIARSPSFETSVTRAPKAQSMGAESEAAWARQRDEPGATQQT